MCDCPFHVNRTSIDFTAQRAYRNVMHVKYTRARVACAASSGDVIPSQPCTWTGLASRQCRVPRPPAGYTKRRTTQLLAVSGNAARLGRTVMTHRSPILVAPRTRPINPQNPRQCKADEVMLSTVHAVYRSFLFCAGLPRTVFLRPSICCSCDLWNWVLARLRMAASAMISCMIEPLRSFLVLRTRPSSAPSIMVPIWKKAGSDFPSSAER